MSQAKMRLARSQMANASPHSVPPNRRNQDLTTKRQQRRCAPMQETLTKRSRQVSPAWCCGELCRSPNQHEDSARKLYSYSVSFLLSACFFSCKLTFIFLLFSIKSGCPPRRVCYVLFPTVSILRNNKLELQKQHLSLGIPDSRPTPPPLPK